MQGKTIQAGEVKLYSESFGDPDNPVMLLIMGAMSSAAWWPQAFCEALAAKGFHVIRFDHRDTGKSSKAPSGAPDYGVEDMADDAVRVLDGYGIDRANIVGMSLGGFLAQLVALKYPDRVQSLTLIASEPLGSGVEGLPPMDQRIIDHHMTAANIDWSDRDAVVAFNVEAWRLTSGSAHPFDRSHIRELAEQDFDRNDNLSTVFNHALLTGGEAWYDQLEEITVPVLVIHGTEDPVLNFGNALALVERIPGAKLLRLDGAGHELHRNDWPVIIDAIGVKR